MDRRTSFGIALALALILGPGAPHAGIPEATSLDVIASATGRVAVSADGSGLTGAGPAPILVDNPSSSATVRQAILTCGSQLGGNILNGDALLDGNPISWDVVVSNAGQYRNAWADVGAIVQPKVDAAPAGLVSFDYGETSGNSLDGCGLYVLFDDPQQTDDRTALILFGGQESDGDEFVITLAEPLTAGQAAEFGLAISFGLQSIRADNLCGDRQSQDSVIAVNGTVISSCAGNADDAGDVTGGSNLITVGGIGDDPANPTDPLQRARDGAVPRIVEDELYDLSTILGPNDTTIRVETRNDSRDDNIFAGHLLIGSAALFEGGIVLTPVSASNPLGTDHTVTAKVVDDEGDPVVGATVTFNILSGPNAGLTGNADTDANGEATFTWTGNAIGIDRIQASVNQFEIDSNEVTKTWGLPSEDVLIDFDDIPTQENGPPVLVDPLRYIDLGARITTTTGVLLFGFAPANFPTHTPPNYLFSNSNTTPGACQDPGVPCDALGDIWIEFFAPGDVGQPATTSEVSFYIADGNTGDGEPWFAGVYDLAGNLLDSVVGTTNDEVQVSFTRPQADIHRLVFDPFDGEQGDSSGIDSVEFKRPGSGVPVFADFNDDGFVGGPDFDIFLQCFNREVPTETGPADDPECLESDLDGDGFVGGADFDLFLTAFNENAPPRCGLGFELVLLLPVLRALRRRGRR